MHRSFGRGVMTHRACLWFLEVTVGPVVQAMDLVASSSSTYLLVAPVQTSLVHREKEVWIQSHAHDIAVWKTIWESLHHVTASVGWVSGWFQLLALESLQSWKRGKLSHELIFWSHSKLLFWLTAPTLTRVRLAPQALAQQTGQGHFHPLMLYPAPPPSPLPLLGRSGCTFSLSSGSHQQCYHHL